MSLLQRLPSEIRAAIVQEARSWVGTRYASGCDIKGVGVDCGMIIIRIFADIGLMEPFDPRPYAHNWHMHRDGEKYREQAEKRFDYVETPEIGDIVMFHVGRSYSHGAVIVELDPLTIVHSTRQYGRVVEEVVSTNVQLAERLPTALYARVRGDFW